MSGQNLKVGKLTRAAYKARRPAVRDVAAGMVIGRSDRDLLSQTDFAKILSGLTRRGRVRVSDVAEQYAEGGPKDFLRDRLERARQLLLADIRSGHFESTGLFVDRRAPSPRRLTQELFASLAAHEPDRLLLERCWITAAAANRWLGKQSRPAVLRRLPGRRTGQGSYAAADALIVKKMRNRVDKGSSVHAAALKYAGEAKGHGAEESKVSRLERRYRRSAKRPT